ncbi:restriction endonuclease subunit S [Laspinema sp. A4]|uniref:restriction endonuclease subunit S n=1 Tax=Laspinema sp. D2d TaxID=2953686 RepID=UPI0021BA871D|nr:restriction endonuclease subunit S [Laspinema sp. D2d]MCT7986373.1 restriction endonuclease subunit S [Laspinema sp. D2d]
MRNYKLSINKPQLPPGYKQTDVGLIPKDWELKTISDIGFVTSGGTPLRTNSLYWGGNIPWITTHQINFNIIKWSEQFITELGLKNSAAKLFPPGTLLMAMYGQGKTRGKVAILGLESSTNQACAAISLNDSVKHTYVFHYLSSQYEAIRDLSNTGNQENLNGLIIKSIKIPIPPLREQETIAQALSDVDALIASLDKLIAKKRHIKTATMQQLLTGKTRLPGFGEGKGYQKTDIGVIPEDWDCTEVGNVTKFLGGYGFSSRFGSNTGTRWLKISNVGIEKINWDNITYLPEIFQTIFKDYILQPKDVVIALTRPILGNKLKIAQLTTEDTPALLNQRVAKLLPRENTQPAFIYYVMQRLYFIISMTIAMAGTDPPNIGNAALEKILIAVPDLPQEQKAIAQVLSDIDTEITALEKRRTKTQAIKQGMMQELLTGRTRLSFNKA